MSPHGQYHTGKNDGDAGASEDRAVQKQVQRYRGEQLGPMVDEMSPAFEQFALQAEAFLHHLWGSPTH